MKQSLRERILAYLKAQQGVWINGGEIEKRSQAARYKASTGSREARRLAEDGLIKNKIEGGSVWYSYEPIETKTVSEFVFDKDRGCMVELKKVVKV